VIEHIPSKYEALSSNASKKEKEKKKSRMLNNDVKLFIENTSKVLKILLSISKEKKKDQNNGKNERRHFYRSYRQSKK
jgi:hypothetical protein